jgi:hypothetical protein
MAEQASVPWALASSACARSCSQRHFMLQQLPAGAAMVCFQRLSCTHALARVRLHSSVCGRAKQLRQSVARCHPAHHDVRAPKLCIREFAYFCSGSWAGNGKGQGLRSCAACASIERAVFRKHFRKQVSLLYPPHTRTHTHTFMPFPLSHDC